MSWFKLGRKKEETEARAEAAAADFQAAAVEDNPVDSLDVPERKAPEALADLFLVMEEHMNELELEDTRELVATLRQPPPLVERLTGGLDDPDDLKEAILSSPTLSADVLRVVNSAAFALSSPISSIEHAVTYLGTTMVRGLVLQSAVAQVMRFETDVQKAAYMRIWRASYISSAAAYAYAQVLGFEDPSIISTRALLVGVGDLALISSRPTLSVIYSPKTRLLDRVAAQQANIMANSAVLSSLLAQQWKLPDDLYTALRYSLTPLTWAPQTNERNSEEQREDIVLYLACRIGDAVAYSGLREIRDFDILAQDSEDFFYLHDYLRSLELGVLIGALADRKHGEKVQQIIKTFGN